jgi:hypothetical protein
LNERSVSYESLKEKNLIDIKIKQKEISLLKPNKKIGKKAAKSITLIHYTRPCV